MTINNLIIEQRTKEWYRKRLGRMTASAFGDLMAKPRYDFRKWSVKATEYIERKAYEVVLDKYIYDAPFSPVAANWGINNEAQALRELKDSTNLEISEIGLVFSFENDQIAATPDAAIWCHDSKDYVCLVQVKCPYNGDYHEKFRTKVFNERDLKRKKSSYYWQMQGEMWVADTDKSYFVSFDPRRDESERLHYALVRRNEEDIRALKQKVYEALEERDAIVEDLWSGKRTLPRWFQPDFKPGAVERVLGIMPPTLI
ncbi:YqaJ viral recombinase family protein [Saprospiraceae bacterium]|nr:YqaJ viral recombinase family protein [Saprospiraceae bacterium]HNO70859.1 YqaJ viral recombinase family protein [Bacteroidia bacterium]